MNEIAKNLRALGNSLVKENDISTAQVAWTGAKEIERLESDRDRWRALAHEVFAAVNENGKSNGHPSIAGKRKDWPGLWNAIDAVVAHVSTFEQENK
jgi:hypothetical protein